MGIDFGFTEESRRESKYALCSPYLKRTVGFYSEPPAEGDDPWAPARQIDYLLDAARLRQERPDLYERLQQSRWHFEGDTRWYFNRAGLGEAYDDVTLRRELRKYVEPRPSAEVRLDKLSAQQRQEALRAIPDGETITAWQRVGYEGHMTICERCPVRPLNDWTCHLRFSSYPGMDGFRAGFLSAVAYADGLTDEQVKEALFSFRHLKAGETPMSKLRELMDELEGVDVNKNPEVFANLVFGSISRMAKDGEHIEGHATDLSYVPFVDEFVSKYLYRDDVYDRAEAKHLMPYLETLREVADWAIWETDEATRRGPLIVFRDRMATMVEGLKIADKFNLHMYVSY